MTNHYPNEQDAEEMARRYGRGNERDELRARIEELGLKLLAAEGQAADNLERAERAEAMLKEAVEALALILPIAKGYAAVNRVGSNLAYVSSAEAILARITQEVEP